MLLLSGPLTKIDLLWKSSAMTGKFLQTTLLTLYGQDGYGNDIAVSASIAISFANFPDE